MEHSPTRGKRVIRKKRKKASRFPAAVLLLALLVAGATVVSSLGAGQRPRPIPIPTLESRRIARPNLPYHRPPAVSPDTSPEPELSVSYDFAAPVPEAAAVEDDWFSDAAFIGDSLTDGLLLYSGVQGPANLSYKGLTVQSARTKAVIKTHSGKRTALEALSQGTYGKVYLLLGVNELGWYNDERFYRCYAELVDLVKASQPDAQIYLQTLLPVTEKKSNTHEYINNTKIAVYNALIAQLAEEKEVYLVDAHTALMDESGALPTEGSTDGVHLTKPYYKLWLDYLRTHTVSH